MWKLFFRPKFCRQLQKLPAPVQEKAIIVLKKLQENPFDQKLKTHKLHGEKKEYYSCSVDFSYRIMFKIEPEKTIILTLVGDHDIYERK